jgi:hypothetical protein
VGKNLRLELVLVERVFVVLDMLKKKMKSWMW